MAAMIDPRHPDHPMSQLIDATQAYVGGLLAALHEALDEWESWSLDQSDSSSGYRGHGADRIAELRAKYPIPGATGG